MLTLAGAARADEHASTAPATGEPLVIDAGPLSKYAANGVYDEFAHYTEDDAEAYKAFFVVRVDDALFALSGLCTHKGCVVEKQKDNSFQCPCHDSTFTATGRCIPGGKAKKSLNRLAIRQDERQHLLVDVRQKLPQP